MTPLQDVRRAFTALTAIREDDLFALDAVAVTFAAKAWKAVPNKLWLKLLGRSASGKDTILDAFNTLPDVERNAIITANALISSYDPKEAGPSRKVEDDPSALRQWDGKVILFHDFTVMQSLGPHAIDRFFSQLRECYEGMLSKRSGTTGRTAIVADFALIIASTEALDEDLRNSIQMGERFLTCRIARRPLTGVAAITESTTRAAKSQSKHIWKLRLREAVNTALCDFLRSGLPTDPDPLPITISDLDLLTTLAWCTIALMTRPSKGLYEKPPPPDRLLSTLRTACFTRALLDGRTALDDTDRAFARRLAYDQLDRPARNLLGCFRPDPTQPVPDSTLRHASGIADSDYYHSLIAQWHHGAEIVHPLHSSTNNGVFAYALTPAFASLLTSCSLLDAAP